MWHVSSCSGVATLRTAIHLLLTYLRTHTRTRGTVQRTHRHLRDEYQLHWATCGLNLPNKKYSQEFLLLKNEKLKIDVGDYTNTLFGCHLGWRGSRKVVAVFFAWKAGKRNIQAYY